MGYATAAHSLSHAYILLLPLLLVLWMEEFEANTYVLGLVAASAYVTFGGGSVPFGFLADRLGARPLLLLYLAGAAAALVLLSLARDVLQLALAAALLGAFTSVHHPTALGLISKEVREQGRGLGYHGMGGSLGIAMGPLVASILLLYQPWRVVLLLFALPALLLLGALAARGFEERAPREPFRREEALDSLATRGFGAVLLVYVLAGVAYWGALTYLPLYLNALPLPSLALGGRPWLPGSYLFAGLLAMGAAGQVAGGALADRPRPEVTLAVASGGVALLLLLLGLPAALPAALAAVAFGFLLFLLEPLQNVLVSARSSGGVRSLAFGLVFLAVFGVGSLGAVLGGALSVTAGLSLLFPLLAPFMAASGLAALALRRWPPQGQPTMASSREE